MENAAFVAAYAVIATTVGMAYFLYWRWDQFFEQHAIRGAPRERLLLHLMLGAAALGAAWPVGIVFALYGIAMQRVRGAEPAPENGVRRVPLL
jgi:hypothetical protein